MPVIATPIVTPPEDTTAIPHPASGGAWYVSTAPTVRPVSPDQLREQAVIDPDAPNSDAELCRYIDAATEYAETTLQTALAPRTIAAIFEQDQPLTLPIGPVIAVQSVVDRNGHALTGYGIRAIGFLRRIVPASAFVAPVTVTYTAGYVVPNTNTPAIPADIRQAILMHAAALYANRESISEKGMTPVPHAMEAFYAMRRRTTGGA